MVKDQSRRNSDIAQKSLAQIYLTRASSVAGTIQSSKGENQGVSVAKQQN